MDVIVAAIDWGLQRADKIITVGYSNGAAISSGILACESERLLFDGHGATLPPALKEKGWVKSRIAGLVSISFGTEADKYYAVIKKRPELASGPLRCNELFAKLSLPTLCFVGDADMMAEPHRMHEFSSKRPDRGEFCKIVEIKGGEHELRGHEEAIARTVTEWLSETILS
eukprot:gnl/TRDRNA2_/TRDRNA2_74962_c0_seq1.p1 gnl/TRDRNA2_/TRDRNA2_74962_c0~~gnl/TRDRNA2_/TRDRNA2_74962_c0_seq1.p1  ORF type:complete len:171 (+),score=25.55 gnl/TRDRNA2_/TRDRNA2_74962_c0_seq1:161-673(+)